MVRLVLAGVLLVDWGCAASRSTTKIPRSAPCFICSHPTPLAIARGRTAVTKGQDDALIAGCSRMAGAGPRDEILRPIFTGRPSKARRAATVVLRRCLMGGTRPCRPRDMPTVAAPGCTVFFATDPSAGDICRVSNRPEVADARKRTSDGYRPRPELEGKDRLLYQTVAARRLQFDNLAWQVPVISLTGQAFLFTIALSGDNSTLARAMASGLAYAAALLSMALISRHRSAEIADADWLRAYEIANFHATFTGEVWASRAQSCCTIAAKPCCARLLASPWIHRLDAGFWRFCFGRSRDACLSAG